MVSFGAKWRIGLRQLLTDRWADTYGLASAGLTSTATEHRLSMFLIKIGLHFPPSLVRGITAFGSLSCLWYGQLQRSSLTLSLASFLSLHFIPASPSSAPRLDAQPPVSRLGQTIDWSRQQIDFHQQSSPKNPLSLAGLLKKLEEECYIFVGGRRQVIKYILSHLQFCGCISSLRR